VTAVLLVAAEAREFSGLRGRSPLGGGHWVMSARGPGPGLAAEAVRIAAEKEDVDALVSIGYCGALDPALGPGDVFAATEVRGGEAWPCQVPPEAPPCATGVVASLDRFVGTVAEKRALREKTGAAVVEMEAEAVAREARRRGLPFYCVKAVTDTAREEFQLDFNAMRDREGRFSRGRVLGAALLRPAAIPELVRLVGRCRLASKSLGEFLAACRF
jgi:adenosylhomocysteine nucleosidase